MKGNRLKVVFLTVIVCFILLPASEENNFYNDIILLDNVTTRIHQNYIIEVNSSDLVKDLINYMIHSTDPYGEFYTINEKNRNQFSSQNVYDNKHNIPAIVNTSIFDSTIGYIWFSIINENAVTRFIQLLNKLSKIQNAGLIIDLRGCAGGLLPSCIKIADYLIPKKMLIVETRSRIGKQNKKYKSKKKPIIPSTIPTIVLVDKKTSSGAELIAGAIQDNGRGKIIGDTTSGIGCVSSYLPLNNKNVLKLTTALFYTPSGKCIDRKLSNNNEGGIIPDSLLYSSSHPKFIQYIINNFILERLFKGEGKMTTNIIDDFFKYIESPDAQNPLEYFFNSTTKNGDVKTNELNTLINNCIATVVKEQVLKHKLRIEEELKRNVLFYERGKDKGALTPNDMKEKGIRTAIALIKN